MAMLSVKNLHVHYGVIEALKGVSIDVNEGEIVSLIGQMVPERQRCCRRSVESSRKAPEMLNS